MTLPAIRSAGTVRPRNSRREATPGAGVRRSAQRHHPQSSLSRAGRAGGNGAPPPGVRTIAAVPSLSDLGQLPKRLVLGRAVRSDRLGESLLPKRYALPIFASDPLSSVAYATQEILIVLTLAGTAFLYLAPWLAVAVVLLLITVVLSYRQVVHAYPSGGGDYEVAMKNHGQFAALVVASALLVDYVMTVAVSVSAGTDNIISAFPSLDRYRVLIAVGLVALLAAVNLRGVRESGKAFALPTYLFISGISVLIVTGLIRYFFTDAGIVSETMPASVKKYRTSPVTIRTAMPLMNRYVGAANALPDSRTPRRLAAASSATRPTPICTRYSLSSGKAEMMLSVPAETETATVMT